MTESRKRGGAEFRNQQCSMGGGAKLLYNCTVNGQHHSGTTPQHWDCESEWVRVRIKTSSKILKQF